MTYRLPCPHTTKTYQIIELCGLFLAGIGGAGALVDLKQLQLQDCVASIALGILGYDLYKATTSLEANLKTRSFLSITVEKAFTDAIKKTIFKPVYSIFFELFADDIRSDIITFKKHS